MSDKTVKVDDEAGEILEKVWGFQKDFASQAIKEKWEREKRNR